MPVRRRRAGQLGEHGKAGKPATPTSLAVELLRVSVEAEELELQTCQEGLDDVERQLELGKLRTPKGKVSEEAQQVTRGGNDRDAR